MLLFLTMPFISMILNIANSVSAIMQFKNIFNQKLLPVVMVFIIVLMFTLFVWSLIGLEYHQNDHKRSVFTCIFLSWQCIIYNFILSYIPYFAFTYLVTGHVKWDKTAHAQTAHATN